MSKELKKDWLPKLQERYARRNREGKTRMIDELCADYHYERKYAIKLLSGGLPAAAGSSPRYGSMLRRWAVWRLPLPWAWRFRPRVDLRFKSRSTNARMVPGAAGASSRGRVGCAEPATATNVMRIASGIVKGR